MIKSINNFIGGRLTDNEVEYWKAFFLKTIKVGIEFEVQFPTGTRLFGEPSCKERTTCKCNEDYFCDIQNGCVYDSIHDDKCVFFRRGLRIEEVCANRGRLNHSNGCQGNCRDCTNYFYRCPANESCPEYVNPCKLCKHNTGKKCEDCDKAIQTVESSIKKIMPPTKSVDIVGSGIHSITDDGSVPNGIEIITVGRRYHFETFYEQNSKIIAKVLENKGFVSNNCSTHFHILSGYTSHGVKELEKPVPQTILANYYQLHNIFAPYLFWITSTGELDYALTRYMLFRMPLDEFSNYYPDMVHLKSVIYDTYQRYCMFNMSNLRFAKNKDIDRFHIELRYPDGNLSPACVTAYIALELALLFKAIELSRYGRINNLPREECVITQKLFKSFANLGTGDRDSDTDGFIGSNNHRLIRKRTFEMIWFLKSQLINLDNYSYGILTKLAETPPSVMRVKGATWKNIDNELYTPLQWNEELKSVVEIIELQKFRNCHSMKNWEQEVSKYLGFDLRKVQKIMTILRQQKHIYYDTEIGQPIIKG